MKTTSLKGQCKCTKNNNFSMWDYYRCCDYYYDSSSIVKLIFAIIENKKYTIYSYRNLFIEIESCYADWNSYKRLYKIDINVDEVTFEFLENYLAKYISNRVFE